MSQNLRHPEILDLLRRDGSVSVETLTKRFNVTEQTIRRDLSELADLGHLDRVHGGAVLKTGTANLAYEERRRQNHENKAQIAQSCASRIPDGASLFLNIGTTTEAVARALLGHRNLLIVTNNMNIPAIFSESPSCDVVLTGGKYRQSDAGLVGSLAIRTIRQFKFDFAIIGCSALDETGDILDYDLAEVSVSQAILEQSRSCSLVADSSKFSRQAPVRISKLSEVDQLITDKAIPMDLANLCNDWNTEIVIARGGR